MKKSLLIVLLAFLGANFMYSQSQVKGGAKKKTTTSTVQKKTSGKNVGTSQRKNTGGKSKTTPKNEELSQEYLVNNVEGKRYYAIVPFSQYYPKYALVYDTHTLRTTIAAMFNISEKFVIYIVGSAIDRDLIQPGEDRGSLILQNGIAERLNREPSQCEFEQEGNVFTFVEKFETDGEARSITHRFRYDKQTDSFFDLDKGITLKEYRK